MASALDAQVVDDVARFDPEGLMDRLESHHGHACGGGPMVAVMKAARARAPTGRPSCATRTAATPASGDKSRVVGYLAAALSAAAAA